MTQYQQLYTGISRAAWGYVFLYFDFKLGTVSILPSFVGIFLFLSAIDLLKESRGDLLLLKPLGILLAAWHTGAWFSSWFETSLEQYFSILPIIINLASMYFHFQFLTDLAALATAYQQANAALDHRIIKWRTLHTLLLTVLSLISYPLKEFPHIQPFLLAVLAVCCCFTGFCIMAALFDLRLLFREDKNISNPP